jgi:ribosomal subunit interface protein
MINPLQITFRGMDRSDAVEADIREKAAKLDTYCDCIMSGSVVIEQLHKHRRQGNLFHCRIDIKVPDAELVSSRQPDPHHSYQDAYVAIRDAFDSMSRQLKRYVKQRRGDVKYHEVPPHGRIAQLTPEQDCGMIETPDGRQIYFHRNSVVNKEFDALKQGAEVRFAEEMGEQGPQASSVQVVGKHHVAG